MALPLAAIQVRAPLPLMPGSRQKAGSLVQGLVRPVKLLAKTHHSPAVHVRTRTPVPDQLLVPALAQSRAPVHAPDPGPDANPVAIRTFFLCV